MKPTIAYIDDDTMNLELIQAIFEEDFHINAFNRGDAFLQELGTTLYDCILSDIHMPHMDGFELYEKIVAHPAYHGCPILFISSDDSDESKIRSLRLGAVDFISRLMKSTEMLARIKSKIQYFKNHRSLIEFDDLRINLTLIKASLQGKELSLTFIELKLLLLSVNAFPEPVPRDVVVDQVWRGNLVQDATIHTHVSNLNSKFETWDYEVEASKTRGIQLMKRGKP